MTILEKTGIGVFISLLLVLGLLVGCKNSAEIKALRIQAVEFSGVKDGMYEGFHDGGLVNARVRATMRGGKMADLKLLEHDHGPFHGADAIVFKVLESQSLNVDAVSGSTASSKVILKAIEKALLQSQ